MSKAREAADLTPAYLAAVRHMDAFGALGHDPKFPARPSTAEWSDYSKVEQDAARLAVRAIIDAYLAAAVPQDVAKVVERLTAINDWLMGSRLVGYELRALQAGNDCLAARDLILTLSAKAGETAQSGIGCQFCGAVPMQFGAAPAPVATVQEVVEAQDHLDHPEVRARMDTILADQLARPWLHPAPPQPIPGEWDKAIEADPLAELAKHTSWELSYNCDKGYEDGDWGWLVHEVRGGRNDREWHQIGFGETPAEALDAAIRSLRPSGSGR